MELQNIKEYTRLNLQRSGLKLSDGDRKAEQTLREKLKAIQTADSRMSTFDEQLKKLKEDGGLWFSNMSLTWWAVVCMSLLAFPLSEYIETGEPMVIGDGLMCLGYLIPAGFLVGRLFLFSFINIAHLVLLVICAVMTLLEIRIFGSDLNWMWVFIVVGTVLTLIGRIWEHFTKVGKNVRWYRQSQKEIAEGEKAIEEASRIYSTMGSEAAAALKKKFPGLKAGKRDPWFLFQRKIYPGKSGKAHLGIPEVPYAPTDFRTQKKSCQQTVQKPRFTMTTTVQISSQSLGYEALDKQEALRYYINNGRVKPYFGMEVPEHIDGLEYRAYVHRWNASVHEVIQNHYTQTTYVKSRAKEQMKNELEDVEWRHLGTSLTNAQLHTDSAGMYYQYQELLDKKKSILDSMPDSDAIQSYNGDREEKTTSDNGNEVAVLEVRTPDGELVGLYSGETHEALCFTEKVAKASWGVELTASAMPSSKAQQAYLYGRFCQ